LLLTSTQVIPRSKQEEEDSALLRGKMEELNKNIVRLISETEKLIEESKQLSERIKSFRRKERTTVGAAA
jgi:predicted  nucleic acid-binding Zn-ribbon protein